MKSFVGRTFAYREHFYIVLTEPFRMAWSNCCIVMWEDGKFKRLSVHEIGDLNEDREIFQG